ncbi:MAG: hypothetical protein HYT81_12520 [Gemmatimonadetes bacterium]|nr:hypothetical protein [Gemmatimonadota bacterium]
MTPWGRLCRTALLLSLTPVPAAAQTASVLLAEGIRAYRDLEFAAAAQLLRRALEPSGTRGLSPTDRLRALMLLGASGIFGEARDQAVAAFRTLVLADPRFRPDTLVFPPRVTQVFQEVLQTTKAIALAAPREARLPAGDRGFAVRAHATSRHRIEARITSAQGDSIATLYRGQITDSVVLAWNGLDSSGSVVPAGRYTLVVTSSLAPDQVLRSVRLPLEVTLSTADTLPWPVAPPGVSAGWDPRFVIPGLLLGAGLAAPAALGIGGAKGARITLGLAFGTIGIVGGRRPASGPAASAEADWRAQMAAAREENQRRRSRPQMIIRTGPPQFREGPTE